MKQRFCRECFTLLEPYNKIGICSKCYLKLKNISKKGNKLKRLCSRCNKYFTPTGKYHKICFDCNIRVNNFRINFNGAR